MDVRIEWAPTNRHLREIIGAGDSEQKRRLYRSYFLEPWANMLRMMGGMAGTGDNEFAGARACGWLLPDELNDVPEALQKLEATGAWETGEEALRRGVERFTEVPFDWVQGWLMIGQPERSNPTDKGYSGGVDWTEPRFLCQYHDASEENLRALPGAVVHELNHLVRLRVFPFDPQRTSVADYIVLEGVAESFATSLFGDEVLGYYVRDVRDDDLAVAKRLVAGALDRTGFDVIRGYIFGDSLAQGIHFAKVGMPDYGGYAVGYHLVQAFLDRTGRTIEEASHLPASEIVEASGYFAH